MASRNERRIERVKTQVPIRHLMVHFGYRVQMEAGDREEQFSCDLHGDGSDTKPSARVYPDNTVYCFACGITRDVIALTRAKLDLGFMEAVDWLEKKFDLPVMPFDASDDEPTRSIAQQVADSISVDQYSVEALTDAVKGRLSRITQERSLPLNLTLEMWEVFDRIVYAHQNQGLPDWKAKRNLADLASAALKKLKEVHESRPVQN